MVELTATIYPPTETTLGVDVEEGEVVPPTTMILIAVGGIGALLLIAYMLSRKK